MEMIIDRSPERWPRLFGLATLAGIELGLIGPFGSYPANLFTRLGYWTGLCWAGLLILWPSVAVALEHGRRRGLPPRFSLALAVLSAGVPISIVAALGCGLFWPVHASGVRAFEWYGATLLVAAPLTGALVWLERMRAGSGATVAPPLMPAARPEPGPPLPISVPPHQLALALCLQMEDHHVRLHLPHGSLLHLASLRDAIAQVGEGRGMQVHRSWWVARDAVRDWAEDGRSVVLILANGLRVPVARNRVAHLRAEGWLAR